ncbi:hypothetical protein KI387_014748, partial [Taxus chinensis]
GFRHCRAYSGVAGGLCLGRLSSLSSSILWILDNFVDIWYSKGLDMEHLRRMVLSEPMETFWRKRKNTETNMLYVESPIGVGFSYSNKSSDYNLFNDTLT